VDVEIRRLGRPGDLGWVVKAHGELYAEEFGFDTSFEAGVARLIAGFARSRDACEAGWIAEQDGRRLGCVLCVRGSDEATAVMRSLLVHPDGRGAGLGAQLIDTCLEFARSAAYRRIKLWTNDPLVVAQRMYVDRGFVLTRKEPHHSFGVDLVEMHYELEFGDE
jgi:GNAT superfamily N-acetyltransferase